MFSTVAVAGLKAKYISAGRTVRSAKKQEGVARAQRLMAGTGWNRAQIDGSGKPREIQNCIQRKNALS